MWTKAKNKKYSNLQVGVFICIFALVGGFVIHSSFAAQDSVVSGTAYYVDCVGGIDTNNGTSQATAWKTLAKASTANLNPGDGILLKRNCTFNNDPLSVSRSGTNSSNIIIGIYGVGEDAPIITRNTNGADIKISGSYITIENLALTAVAPSTISALDTTCPSAPVGNIQGITFESGATNNTVKGINATSFYAGVYIKSGAHHNRIINNTFLNNTMMSPLDTSADNDAGAFGVLLWGDDNEIANNQIDGNDACSYDYSRDGAAIEIYGGQRNNIHHNKAHNDDAFTELGNNRSSDNTYAYNQFTSDLQRSIFLNTRGSANTTYGPVTNTKAYNNTVYLTGSTSQGIVCSSGCSPTVLTARNNILWASKSLYADAAFAESNNLYWKTGGSPTIQNAGSSTVSASSKKVNPQFINDGIDFHLQSTSPAKDAGSNESVSSGYTSDLDGKTVPASSAVDIGSYEEGALTPNTGGTSFTFGSVGDHANNTETGTTFNKIGASATRPDFFISLGDLSYGTLSELSWCSYVKSKLDQGAGSTISSTYPFEIISGGHENGLDNVGDGLIDNFTQCLPNMFPNAQISSNGGTAITGSFPLGTSIPSISGSGSVTTNNYGKEYYFDYPATNPTARFILASPKQNFQYGGRYDYDGSLDANGNPVASSTPHYKWLASAIDGARAAGIKWVIVGNHENYISMGIKSDEVGSPYFNLLIAKKVDLIMQGHDHNYQRSKQLAHSASCTSITTSAANTSCIASGSATNSFTKGTGTLLIINGASGHGHYAITSTDSQAPYFVATNDTGYGFMRYTVTPTSISGSYIATTGSFSDSFNLTDTTTPTALTADINGDHIVNILDITMILIRFARTDTDALMADINNDSAVNNLDLLMALRQFGQAS